MKKEQLSNSLSLLFIVFVFFSCTKKTESFYSSVHKEGENMIELVLGKNDFVEKYSNLYSEVNYVSLEETRNSIVGTISKLEITNDGDFIVFDNIAGAVFRFDSNGKFLNNIGLRGPGENEYMLPNEMKYDPFSNKVLIWDNGKHSILTYNLNGKMESKIVLPWIIETFGIIDKDYIVCYLNNDDDLKGNEKGTNFKIINHNGAIEKEFGEFGSEMIEFHPACKETFKFQQGRCLCMTPFSSEIYTIDKESYTSVASIDFHENAIPSDWLKGSHRELRDKIKKYSNLIYCKSFYEADRFYILNLVKNKAIYLCFVNKENSHAEKTGKMLINDLKGMVTSTSLLQVKDNNLYFEISPQEIEARCKFVEAHPKEKNLSNVMIKELDGISYKLLDFIGEDDYAILKDSLKKTSICIPQEEVNIMRNLSMTNNPIIQICTLK